MIYPLLLAVAVAVVLLVGVPAAAYAAGYYWTRGRYAATEKFVDNRHKGA